jgi:hypothetical protein
MRLRLLAVLFLLALATCALAHAQRNELGVVVGGNFVGDQSLNAPGFTGDSVRISTGLTYEGVYARRFFNARVAASYFELPVAGTPNADVRSSDPNVPTALASLFITPSVKLKLLPGTGFSPWVSVGGGYARFDEGKTLQNGASNFSSTGTNTNAVQFGGGLDLRLIPLIGFRAEVRDYWTGTPNYNGSTSSDRQHNLLVGGGLVLNF